MLVPRGNRSEVASVQRDKDGRPDALGERDYRGIGAAEREVRVPLDELGNPLEVLRSWPFDVKRSEASEEPGLGISPQAHRDEVSRLGDDQRWDDQSEVSAGQNSDASAVVVVVAIRGRIQRTGVNYGPHDRPTR